jgi:glyoxylase I family protein
LAEPLPFRATAFLSISEKTALSITQNGNKRRAFLRETAKEWPMNLFLEHLGLAASDPATLKDWYVKTLGAKVAYDNGQTPPMFLVQLPGGVMLEIYAGDLALEQTRNNKLNGWRHIALRVPSLEETKAELEQRGVRFTEEIKPAGGGGRVLFFPDAEGNLLHLVERSVDSPVR